MTEVVRSVKLTRTELVALKETIELTPRFEGRTEARDAVREALRLRQTKPSPLRLEESILAALVRRVVPIDVQTSALRLKLSRAIQRESLG